MRASAVWADSRAGRPLDASHAVPAAEAARRMKSLRFACFISVLEIIRRYLELFNEMRAAVQEFAPLAKPNRPKPG